MIGMGGSFWQKVFRQYHPCFSGLRCSPSVLCSETGFIVLSPYIFSAFTVSDGSSGFISTTGRSSDKSGSVTGICASVCCSRFIISGLCLKDRLRYRISSVFQALSAVYRLRRSPVVLTAKYSIEHRLS